MRSTQEPANTSTNLRGVLAKLLVRRARYELRVRAEAVCDACEGQLEAHYQRELRLRSRAVEHQSAKARQLLYVGPRRQQQRLHTCGWLRGVHLQPRR